MRDIFEDAVSDAAHRLDAGSVRALYAAVSVPVERERERLRRSRRPFVDPAAAPADPVAVRQTAEFVLDQAVFRATALGGVAGAGGLASIPPEVLATLVSIVRTAQRLAVVYGFDPETDRGQMALRQALSAGLEVDLPEGGPMGLRLSHLPGMLTRARPREVTASMTRQLVSSTARLVVGSIGRFIPGISAGVGAVDGRRRMRRIGERMCETLEHLSELPTDRSAGIVDAVEVPTAGHGG